MENYLVRKAEATEWLYNRGRKLVAFFDFQEQIERSLVEMGRFKLKMMNAREEAFAYLQLRNSNASRLVIRQKEAIEFLKQQHRGIFENEMNLQKANNWLVERAQTALRHLKRQYDTFQKLQVIPSILHINVFDSKLYFIYISYFFY